MCDNISMVIIMYEYIIGKIKDIESNYIVVENNNIGYLIYTILASNRISKEKQVETL